MGRHSDHIAAHCGGGDEMLLRLATELRPPARSSRKPALEDERLDPADVLARLASKVAAYDEAVADRPSRPA